ncbi:hypothetical protein NMY22_g14023 [Coprinellus aureogranulatus]|nr:hypothetical protein NMY22_g14023 [Coprinellus aureogranulatus]
MDSQYQGLKPKRYKRDKENLMWSWVPGLAHAMYEGKTERYLNSFFRVWFSYHPLPRRPTMMDSTYDRKMEEKKEDVTTQIMIRLEIWRRQRIREIESDWEFRIAPPSADVISAVPDGAGPSPSVPVGTWAHPPDSVPANTWELPQTLPFTGTIRRSLTTPGIIRLAPITPGRNLRSLTCTRVSLTSPRVFPWTFPTSLYLMIFRLVSERRSRTSPTRSHHMNISPPLDLMISARQTSPTPLHRLGKLQKAMSRIIPTFKLKPEFKSQCAQSESRTQEFSYSSCKWQRR